MFESVTGAQLLNAGSSVLSSVLKPSAAGPSFAQSGGGWLSFDNSGWTVATGKATADGSGIDLSQWALLGLAALVVLAWVKKKS